MPLAKDLTGRRFGRLTAIKVVGRVGFGTGAKRVWECACDCGKVVQVKTDKLLKGSTKSCGCLRSDLSTAKTDNLLGKRFGMLSVVGGPTYKADPRRKRKAWWLCDCDCGARVEVRAASLKSGESNSCGCDRYRKVIRSARARAEAMVGTRVDRLSIVGPVDSRRVSGNSELRIGAVCDCGSGFKMYSVSSLRNRPTSSCGCRTRDALVERVRNPDRLNQSVKWKIAYTKVSASRRGYTFTLDFDLFYKLVTSPCSYCGRPIKLREDGKYELNGVDRVDNSVGYEPDNVIPACRDCNNSRGSRSVSEFLAWVSTVYAHTSDWTYNATDTNGHQSPGHKDPVIGATAPT